MTKDLGAVEVQGKETDHLLWQNSLSVTGAVHLKCLTSQHGLRLINPSEVNFMKNLKNLAAFIATAALATAAVAQNVDNWRNSTGDVWKNGTNELCWQDANWTPATAAPGCGGAVAAPKAAAPAAAATKVTYAADAFFDFDKSVLKPAGKAKLDDLVQKVKGINLEVIIAVGHTDSIGSDAYNQKLSVRRAEAVKAYLVSKGIEKNRIYTEGKGEKQPVADNKTKEGRAKNRRVEIEVVGTRKN
jgi:OOP family OmpA-OmpF porin